MTSKRMTEIQFSFIFLKDGIKYSTASKNSTHVEGLNFKLLGFKIFDLNALKCIGFDGFQANLRGFSCLLAVLMFF